MPACDPCSHGLPLLGETASRIDLAARGIVVSDETIRMWWLALEDTPMRIGLRIVLASILVISAGSVQARREGDVIVEFTGSSRLRMPIT